MGLLNEDYSEIKRQIDYADSRFISCKTRDDFASCFATYEILCELYKMSTGEDLFDLSGPIKLTAAVASDGFRREKITEFYDEFYNYRDISHNFFKKVYDEAALAYIKFIKADAGYLDSLPKKELSCDMEAMEIFYSFLDSEFPEAKVFFDELLSEGRVFKTGPDIKYRDRRGYSFYNSLEGIGNMFLRDSFRTIGDLSAFGHEFGHMVDSNFLSNVSSSFGIPISNSLRFDVEALSCHYQFKFLEYLIKNGIYKEDAQRELAENLVTLFYHLENGLLVTMANLDEFNKLKFGRITKEWYISSLLDRKSDIEFPEYLDLDDLNYFISIPETASYAYGLVLASAISDKSSCVRFMTSCNEDDFSKRLDRASITPEKAAHQLVKKIETLYT